MDITLSEAAPAEVKLIRKLYRAAFPKEERAPFGMMARKARQGKGRMLAARDKDGFAGFAYVADGSRCVYLLYLAVSPEKRGTGCGSAILAKLREMYRDKRIFLAREALDPAADNYNERVRRREFYLRCGFEDLSCKIREYKLTYDVMSTGGDVTPDDYAEIVAPWCGKFLVKHAPMKLFYPTD